MSKPATVKQIILTNPKEKEISQGEQNAKIKEPLKLFFPLPCKQGLYSIS